MTARQNNSGGLLFLEEQDRERWDRMQLQIGMKWLGKSAQRACFSQYHAEAGIAAEHCLAPSFLGHGRVEDVRRRPNLVERFADHSLRRVSERVFMIDVVAFDWICPKFITPRYAAAEFAGHGAPAS